VAPVAAAASASPVAQSTARPAKPEKPARAIVLASASPDFELPREAVPKAEIAVTPAIAEPAPAVSTTARPQSAPTKSAARATSLYFGAEPIAELGGGLEPWSPNGMYVVGDARNVFLDEEADANANVKLVSLDPRGGESIVSKGVVPGDGRSLLSPAERLGLVGEERVKSEKCLAEAIYFESRGEPERGQVAVAQVVMNRVFSGYYPTTVCGVVYQNAHRKLACQFTFACDGIPDKVTEPNAMERAKRIARETLDGQHWLPDVGKATHYHAYWVRPHWVRTMNKLDKIGVHTFYRPRNWGDGAEKPAWGDAEINVPLADRL
jgi:hypothetical protein